MSRTYVSFEGHAADGLLPNGFWMNDSLLEIWLRFLALHIEAPVTNGSLATAIRDQWLLASRGQFRGCCPHGLADAVATPEGAALVRGAIVSLLGALSTGGNWIAKDTLNLMGFSSGKFGRDIVARQFVEIGQTFLDLLDRKIAPHGERDFMMRIWPSDPQS